MARVLILADGAVKQASESWRSALKAATAESPVWIDMESGDPLLDQLSQELPIHALALEDAKEGPHRVKLEDYPKSVYINLIIPSRVARSQDLRNRTPVWTAKPHGSDVIVGLFVTETALVSVRHGATDGWDDRVRERWEDHAAVLSHGVWGLAHAVFDVLGDVVLEAADSVAESIENAQDQAFSEYQDFREVHLSLYRVHRQGWAINALAEGTQAVTEQIMDRLSDEAPMRFYYRNVADHLAHAARESRRIMEESSALLNLSMGQQDTQLNITMKKVSGWAAVIAVPTLITGLYGMNVIFPGYNTAWGTWVAVGIVAVVTVGLYLQFKWRNWL